MMTSKQGACQSGQSYLLSATGPEQVHAPARERLISYGRSPRNRDLVVAPRRVGKPLRRELAGVWSARRGSYRVLYEIDEAKQPIVVLRIDHHADIYRP
jgi:mRNA interferase RelE/StbE